MINIEINSQNIKPGDTFVAIKGATHDGHNFIEDAIKNGAKKIIVSNNKTYSVETVNVPDTKEYLENYIVNNYSKELDDLKIIGITGTNGKTTTAYMTYQLLMHLNIKSAYIGTIGFYYNNNKEETLNTTPDILNMYKMLLKAKENGCKIVILEASSIGLAENRLKGIKYDAAVFTNLTHDHLDYHENMDNYKDAKLIMFNNLKENGLAIINNDDSYAESFKINKNIKTYGFNEADIKCIDHNEDYTKITYEYNNSSYTLNSPLFGKYNVYNIMASIIILDYLGININDINEIYPILNPPKGRINVIRYKDNKIIIDYAHTPDGVEQVITSTKEITSGNLYVVFGCPGSRDKLKRPIMGKIVSENSNFAIITDDDPHYEDEMDIINEIIPGMTNDKYKILPNRKEAIHAGIDLLNSNDTLLILGKGHEEVIIIRDKKVPHNDAKCVLEYLDKIA